MREGWREISLGEVFRLDNARLGSHDDEPPVLSLSKYDGLVFAADYFDKRIASAQLGNYKIVHADDWAYSTIHIDEGSIARNNLGCVGVISPMYTTLKWSSAQHDPDFFELLLRSPGMLSQYRDHAQGSVNRRRSLPFSAFASLITHVPPMTEQRRIVDLVRSVAGVTQTARRFATTSRAALDSHLAHWCDSYDGPRTPLGDLADLASGPSWKAADERTTPNPGSVRVLGITNTPHGEEVDLTDVKYVGGLPASTRLLGAGSLLMIRTNGNRSRIGNVYRVPPAADGLAYSAFQIGVHVRSVGDADFAYWMLRNPELQRTISENASGSTGLGNIAVKWLKRLELPWPGIHERSAAVQLFDALQETVSAAEGEEHASSTLRAAMCSELLSGNHEIPDSYDALLEPA
jgi:hypothetical protein